jgi:hypothetical protein
MVLRAHYPRAKRNVTWLQDKIRHSRYAEKVIMYIYSVAAEKSAVNNYELD